MIFVNIYTKLSRYPIRRRLKFINLFKIRSKIWSVFITFCCTNISFPPAKGKYMLQLLTTAIVHFSSFFRVFIFTSVSLTFLIIKPLEKHFLVYFILFFFRRCSFQRFTWVFFVMNGLIQSFSQVSKSAKINTGKNLYS